MKFELFVALRYLRAKRKQTMVSVISAISVLGIAAGVMALVIALAYSAGFKEDVQSKFLGTTSAINLFRIDRTPLTHYEPLLRKIGKIPHVTGRAPAIFKEVLIASSSSNQGAVLKGVIPNREKEISDFFSHVIEGDPRAIDEPQVPRVDKDSLSFDNIMIGKEMASNLGVTIGDTLKALYPQGSLMPLGMKWSVKTLTLRVAAIFESGLWDIDANWAYVHIHTARRLFSFPSESALAIQFQIDDLENAEAIASDICDLAGPGYTTTTWIELNKHLFSALKLEKITLFVTIGLIVFVASLNIVTTLIMMVLEKQGDIAILAAMGATGKIIHRIFMLQGLVIGVIGTLLGNILGMAICWILDHYQLIRLEPEIYSIPYVPFHVRIWDSVLISSTAVLISYLATIYPARNASKLDPVEVLRYE
jgi:lipoprotein-releasing system permease protein